MNPEQFSHNTEDISKSDTISKHESPEQSNLEQEKNLKVVKEVFELYPELSTIGSEQQYQEYLLSIFPNSKLQSIVWHGSPHEFENFDPEKLGTNPTNLTDISKIGFFFTDNRRVARAYGADKPFLLNIERPAIIDDENYGNVIGAAEGAIKDAISKTANSDGAFVLNFKDAVVMDEEMRTSGDYLIKQNQYIVFKPEQIYRLGNQVDQQNFSDYIKLINHSQ